MLPGSFEALPSAKILEVVFHRYPEKSVLLLFYSCDLLEGEPRPIECDEVRWVAFEELPSLDWAPADVPFVRRLAGLENYERVRDRSQDS